MMNPSIRPTSVYDIKLLFILSVTPNLDNVSFNLDNIVFY